MLCGQVVRSSCSLKEESSSYVFHDTSGKLTKTKQQPVPSPAALPPLPPRKKCKETILCDEQAQGRASRAREPDQVWASDRGRCSPEQVVRAAPPPGSLSSPRAGDPPRSPPPTGAWAPRPGRALRRLPGLRGSRSSTAGPGGRRGGGLPGRARGGGGGPPRRACAGQLHRRVPGSARVGVGRGREGDADPVSSGGSSWQPPNPPADTRAEAGDRGSSRHSAGA